MKTSRTFLGTPLDLANPDAVGLSFTDLAVQLARCCRYGGAIWSDSLLHATVGITLCDQLGLSPWVRAHVVARTLPDAFLGAPGPVLDAVPALRALRTRWARSIRCRLGLLEVEPLPLRLTVDAVERRLTVLELTAGSHASGVEAAALNGGKPSGHEITAWQAAMGLRVSDRARHTTTPAADTVAGVVPKASRRLIAVAVKAVETERWNDAVESGVVASWFRLLEHHPGLVFGPNGDPIDTPESMRLPEARTPTEQR